VTQPNSEQKGTCRSMDPFNDYENTEPHSLASCTNKPNWRPIEPSEPLKKLTDAIEWAETNHPLPRCEHGKALKDGAGELLEPSCGCRWAEPASSSVQPPPTWRVCPTCNQSMTEPCEHWKKTYMESLTGPPSVPSVEPPPQHVCSSFCAHPPMWIRKLAEISVDYWAEQETAGYKKNHVDRVEKLFIAALPDPPKGDTE